MQGKACEVKCKEPNLEGIRPGGALLELPRLATRVANSAAAQNGIPSAESQSCSLLLMIEMYGISDACFFKDHMDVLLQKDKTPKLFFLAHN